ncbi:GntR family transcriptional regulator [Thalassospira sp. TSL5-1]|uniref:GntR family transcriptional regulator n=1 Tax=Thalassospira sp. TSL5-1 TaxID=1544451 RepID=UPI00093EF94A|nr:GntR family transcriptional regulator [Thalassospira sp. TSL5-1]OKH86764.1 GntR family transcriptional regulator [Thalassospira sp. TSL5-1]
MPGDVLQKSLSDLQAELARKVLHLAQNGHWEPGEHVSEIKLANELGTSRSPVRSVLQILEHFGVFSKIPNVGFRFAGIASEQFDIDAWLPRSELEDLYEKIMIARASGHIGVEVSEAELAEQFGRSRGVVRRVMMRFANSGLAERRTGHGWRFAETLDRHEAINESYAYRIIIECGAIRESSFEPVMSQLQDLRSAQTAILQRPLAETSGSAWFEANANFHSTVVSWANNRFLSESIARQNNLRRMTEFVEFTRLTEERIKKSARDHLAILDALEKGDKEGAVDILYRHLSRTSIDEKSD